MQAEHKFKVGDMAYLDNRRGTRALILFTPTNGRYPVLLDFGSVGNYSEGALMTLPEWLEWWENFRDEITPKEWRETAENAKREFVPPPDWEEAVERAKQPYGKPGDTHQNQA